MKKPLIILTGPTAVGKTELSLALAKAVNGEIISADSMQVYKYMNIGTAKIRPEEMDGVPHYLVDVLDPKEAFNVVVFQKLAKAAMADIYSRNKVPIIVGGTGFYIQALLYDIDFTQTNEDVHYRQELEAIAKAQGNDHLHQKLALIDPASAEKIPANNVKRVIRALEYYKLTGEPISKHNEVQRQKTSPYNFCCFVLTHQREVLYQRIDKRVDLMIEEGLVQEVSTLLEQGYAPTLVSMQGLGYKELVPYLYGETTLDEAVYILKRDTRHFAKRQLTWFRREREVTWVDKALFNSNEDILQMMITELKERKIIE